MNYRYTFLKYCLLLLLSGATASLMATGVNCGDTSYHFGFQQDDPIERTYVNKSIPPRVGASSWKWSRQARAGDLEVDKSSMVEITYDDFLNHLRLGQDRTVRIVELTRPNTLSMNVGAEGVTDAVWVMPDLSLYEGHGLQTLAYASRDVSLVEDAEYFGEATQSFQLGDDAYQFLELVPDEDGVTGYLDYEGHTDSEFFYEVNSTLTPVPMALGLGVFESQYGPELCRFFGDSCRGIPGEDHFTIVQTYEEVASGMMHTFDGESSEGIKLRNTDSITIFDADSLILDIVIANYLVWYTKNGHYIKAFLAEHAPWTGQTDFITFEYQKVAASVLPVSWLGINAEVIKNREVKINWSTANELENERFAIERSIDGQNFSPIANQGAFGYSQTQQDYSYTDKEPIDGFNYYRIQQQDVNGQYTYSSIVSALITRTASAEELIVLYPNPGRNEVHFSRPADYELLTIEGKVLAKGRVEEQLNVAELPVGTYLVRIDGGEAFRWVKQ